MHKRNMLCSAVLCLLLILSSCSAGVNGATPTAAAGTSAPAGSASAAATAGGGASEGLLDTLCSVTDAFVKASYSVSLKEAKEFEQLMEEAHKVISSAPHPTLGVYSLKDLDPDLDRRIEDLFKRGYRSQPLTDKGLKSIEALAIRNDLWRLALSEDSDIEVTSVKSALNKTLIDDKRNYMKYTINLLVNKTSYEVNGVLALALIDGKWMVDSVRLDRWMPELPY